MQRAFASGMWVACAVVLALQIGGCAAAPRQKPRTMGPVDTGAGSLEATRRELAGSWTLSTLEVVAPDGTKQPVKARGTLTYDAYGAMAIDGVVEDPQRAQAIVLNYSGRIVIDPAKKEFYPADMESAKPVAAGQMAPVSLDKVRRFELGGDRFVVTYLDSAGKPTAVAAWNRKR